MTSRRDLFAGKVTILPSRMKFLSTASSGIANARSFPLSGRDPDTERIGARELRSRLVEHVEFGDSKSRLRQQVDDRPREMAAARDPLLQRVKAPLPASDPFVGREPMLKEVQLPPWLEHAAQLG